MTWFFWGLTYYMVNPYIIKINNFLLLKIVKTFSSNLLAGLPITWYFALWHLLERINYKSTNKSQGIKEHHQIDRISVYKLKWLGWLGTPNCNFHRIIGDCRGQESIKDELWWNYWVIYLCKVIFLCHLYIIHAGK